MFKNIEEFRHYAKRTGKQAGLWAYAAWTLPFTALALLAFEHFIGRDDWIAVTLVIITTTFFSISVMWWWWAITKIVVILEYAKQNEERFNEIRENLNQVRVSIREELNVGDRQWREPRDN